MCTGQKIQGGEYGALHVLLSVTTCAWEGEARSQARADSDQFCLLEMTMCERENDQCWMELGGAWDNKPKWPLRQKAGGFRVGIAIRSPGFVWSRRSMCL